MKTMWLIRRLRAYAARRPPSFVIGSPESPYLRRWFLIPRNRFFNIYLHQFLRSDDDRALHTHPWLFNISWILDGDYIEHLPIANSVFRRAGNMIFRGRKAAHRIELINGAPVWTVFVTGPRIQEWGFLCPKGFRHWREFCDPSTDGATVGKGCD